MPSITGKHPGRKTRCPHCWKEFFSSSEALYRSHDGQQHHPETVSNWDKPADSAGRRMASERACPYCSLPVALRLMQYQTLFMSIVGPPQSGKTYLLASMYHTAKEQLASQFNSSVTFPGESSELIYSYLSKLFNSTSPDELNNLPKTWETGDLYTQVQLEGVSTQLPKPFAIQIADRLRKRRTVSLVTWDNAGESFTKARGFGESTRVIDHIEHSDCIMLVIDPLRISKLVAKLKAADIQDPQMENLRPPHEQESMVNDVIERMDALRNKKSAVAQIPLCVVVQKWDLLKKAELVPELQRLDPSTGAPVELFDETPINVKSNDDCFVDMEELRAISVVVRHILKKYEPNLVNSVEAHFDIVRYFGVSALGASPEWNPETPGLMSIRPASVEPFRITDPLYWLLGHKKIIPTAVSSRRDKKLLAAKLVMFNPNSKSHSNEVKVQSPHKGKPWVRIDKKYLDKKHPSLIPDPDNKKFFVLQPVTHFKLKSTKGELRTYSIDDSPVRRPVVPAATRPNEPTPIDQESRSQMAAKPEKKPVKGRFWKKKRSP